MEKAPGSESNKNGGGSARRKISRTLFQANLLLIAVLILSGFATYFIYCGSQNRLIGNSKKKLIRMEVNNICSVFSYGMELLPYLGQEKLKGLNEQMLVEAAAKGRPTPIQRYVGNTLIEMVKSKFLGLKEVVVFLPPAGAGGEPLVVASSSGDPAYKPELPDNLVRAVGNGDRYVWAKDGVPELGATGSNLVVTKKISLTGTDIEIGAIAIKPMDGDIAAIDRFLDSKKSECSRNVLLLTVISILAMSLLSIIFMAFLIHRRITKPMGELSALAMEVMEGDLDVEIKVRKGEEFARLKKSFRTMIENFKAVLSFSLSEKEGSVMTTLPEGGDVEKGPVENKRADYFTKAGLEISRSRTLYYITIFLIIMFVVSGTVNFFVFLRWQGELIDDSVNRMIQNVSEGFVNGSVFVRHSLDPLVTEKLEEEGELDLSTSEMVDYLMDKKISPYQRFYNELTKDIIDKGLMGMERIMVVISGGWVPGGAMVVVSNNPDQIYKWEVPDYLVKAIEEDKHYLYFENGVPELGLKGEQTITIKTFELAGVNQAYVGAKSMHAEVTELNRFYDNERKNLFWMLFPVMAGSLALLVLLTFIVLDFLIRKNITKPMIELSAAAEQVMEGNLDVEITVHEGDELEGLERAFREMVESFRKLIAKATGQE